MFCAVFWILGVRLVKNEYQAKLKYGYEFSQGDFKGDTQDILKLSLISFFASIAAVFCGVGAGSMFVPVLTIIGIHPQVASATGMYVTMFVCLTGSIVLIVFQMINLQYAVYVQLMTFMGTIPGIFFQGYIIKTTGKQSYVLILLTTCLLIAICMALGINIHTIMSSKNVLES